MKIKFDTKSFDSAVKLLSPPLKELLFSLDEKDKSYVYEIRMRANKPIILVTKEGMRFLNLDSTLSKNLQSNSLNISPELLREIFNRFCSFSVHTHLHGIVKGYVTLQGGHRAGICGTAVYDHLGNVTSMKDISSINLRIARQVKGSALTLVEEIFKKDTPGIIIAGAPGSGKTTILRDLVRILSSEPYLKKVALIDERQEIAGMNSGIPQNDVGINCDVLDCFKKGQAVEMALKTLSPEIIALDEVARDEEIDNISFGVNSGVRFILTVHASSFDEIIHREQIIRLIETYSFEKLVMLSSQTVGEIEKIYEVGELRDEIIRSGNYVACGRLHGSL